MQILKCIKCSLIKHQPNSFKKGVLYSTVNNKLCLKMFVTPIHLLCYLIIPKLTSTFMVLIDNIILEYIVIIFYACYLIR